MNLVQDCWIPLVLTGIILALDILVDHRAELKDIVCCIIDLPKEILLLSLGFVLTYTSNSNSETIATEGVLMILLLFFILLIIYCIRHRTTEQYNSFDSFKNGIPISQYLSLGFFMLVSLALSLAFFFLDGANKLGFVWMKLLCFGMTKFYFLVRYTC